MNYLNLAEELASTTYPGRGIVLGRSQDGKKWSSPTSSWAEVKTAATAFL